MVELWSALECGREDVRVVHPKSTPMDPIDRSCLKVLIPLSFNIQKCFPIYSYLEAKAMLH